MMKKQEAEKIGNYWYKQFNKEPIQQNQYAQAMYKMPLKERVQP